MNWSILAEIFKFAAVMAAGAIVGRWFLSEVKNARRKNLPWYKPYLKAPGILILCAIAIPLILWIVRN